MPRVFVAALLLAVVVFVPATQATQLTPRLLLELDEEASVLAREQGTLPASLAAVAGPQVRIEPIFHVPANADLRASWYDLGLDRWFRVHGLDNAETLVHQVVGGDVRTAELDGIHSVQVLPDDYDIHNMWGLTQMECPEAWDLYQAESDVIVCTIDTGCKITHEDLADNMWINPGEDLNGNGVWDDSDNNGIDDDGNGFIDDLSGWDFVSANDPWGEPAVGEDYGPRDNEVFPDTHGHGTHVMGTAAARTNNGIGVAAASWNAVAMSLRAGFAWLDGGSLQGSGYSSDFMAAIQYAVENGARVISISFGGGGSQQAYQDVITFARENNVLVFASAGNNGDQSPNYPAAYDGAIAVVATTTDDYKAGFSTYGDWVGLSAPGTGIWSTMVGENYRPQDYVAWQGTSMASPNAASVAAYVLGYMPDLTDDQLELLLKMSCDDIDGINYMIAGLLGSGRVNARRAIEWAPSVFLPYMDPVDASVDRSNGEVTVNWSITPDGTPGFSGFNVYRNGELILSETPNTTLTEMLPGPGDYTYTVRAVFDGDETFPESVDVSYSGLYGVPIVDDFEADDLPATWEVIQSLNTRTFISRVYQGERSVGVSSPANLVDGIQRYFPAQDEIVARAWFQVTGFPIPGGEAAAVHLYAGDDDRIRFYAGDYGYLWLATPDNGLTQLSSNPIEMNAWYHVTIEHRGSGLHVFVMTENGGVIADEMLPAQPLFVDGVLFGSRNLDNSWTFFDAATVMPLPTDFEYYTPVLPGVEQYPVIVTEGVPGDLVGQEIAVMDGNLVVGAYKPEHHTYPFVVFATEDPGNGQGFTFGMPIGFEAWDSGSNAATTLYIQTIEQGDGLFGTGSSARVSLGSTDVDDLNLAENGLPRDFAVSDVYPNPFNPETTVQLSLPATSDVTVSVYNVMGQRVATLAQGSLQAGIHSLTFDGSELASGLYFLHAQVPGQLNELRKLTLMK